MRNVWVAAATPALAFAAGVAAGIWAMRAMWPVAAVYAVGKEVGRRQHAKAAAAAAWGGLGIPADPGWQMGSES